MNLMMKMNLKMMKMMKICPIDSDNDSIVIDDDTVETLDITEVMDSDDDK